MTSQQTINKVYEFDNYNLTLCTDESTNMFISVTNKTTYQNYEIIIEETDLDERLNLNKFAKIIYGCFESKTNYSFDYELNMKKLIIHFNVCFDGYYNIKQTVEINEKILSHDKKFNAKIIELETRINEMETEEIIFGYRPGTFGQFIKVKRNIQEIDFRHWLGAKLYGNLVDFNKLTFLRKIIINDDGFGYSYQSVVFKLSQIDVNDIINIACNQQGYLKPTMTHSSVLTNMFDSPEIYLPNVTEIIIHKNTGGNFNNMKLRSLPKLNTVRFEQYKDNLLQTFNFIRENKIKNVIYNNCANIEELKLIENDFKTNNYNLIVMKK